MTARWISCLFSGLALAVSAVEAPPNTLTPTERDQGWQLLFDGKSTAGWRGFNRPTFPDRGWVVTNDTLHLPLNGGGGDIITEQRFSNYEFAFEWKVTPGANGGIKYFIDEQRRQPIGHEYQLLGPRSNAEALRNLREATASFYHVLPPSTNALPRPPGEWNTSRIRIQGLQVEHWLNGERVLQYTLGSQTTLAGIARSKFKDTQGFGTAFPHPLLLQDHGGGVWFRNLKLRPLPQP